MPDDYIKNTVLACLGRTLTASLGPMAKNAMMVDLVTFAIFIIKVNMWPVLYSASCCSVTSRSVC
jgi:hypothetical protein